MNEVVLIGRMTKDPELRRTNTGESVTSFTLAVNRNYQSADGVQADYIPCVVWGKRAENTERYCSKGSQVAVSGNLRTRNYENTQGQKVYVTEVICNNVEFLNTKKEQQEQVPQNNFYSTKAVDVNKGFNDPFAPNFNVMEDDIAF